MGKRGLFLPLGHHGDEGRGRVRIPVLIENFCPVIGWKGLDFTSLSGTLVCTKFVFFILFSHAHKVTTNKPYLLVIYMLGHCLGTPSLQDYWSLLCRARVTPRAAKMLFMKRWLQTCVSCFPQECRCEIANRNPSLQDVRNTTLIWVDWDLLSKRFPKSFKNISECSQCNYFFAHGLGESGRSHLHPACCNGGG